MIALIKKNKMAGKEWSIFVLLLFFTLFVQNIFAQKIENDVSLSEICVVNKIIWTGEYSAFDEAAMNRALGKPCEAWRDFAAKVLADYENRGFIGASLEGKVERNVLLLNLKRGDLFVWAAAENLEPGVTSKGTFQKLSGIEEGAPVSLSDLNRSDRKLSRLGYFERTAPVRIFRDPHRNRIIPAYSMRDAHLSEAEGLLTYSSEDNLWEGEVNVNLYNILGTARDLQLHGFSGADKRTLRGSYKEPWVLGTFWNIVVRGDFDEEIFDGDSLEKSVMGEIGVTHDVGFDFSVGVFVGISDMDKHSSLELKYVSLDRFALPRSGKEMDVKLVWKMDRPDSLDNFLSASFNMVLYYPLVGNFINRIGFSASGIFPPEGNLWGKDLFALGGMQSFKGMPNKFLRTRTFGFSEIALLWQDGYDLSVEVFYQPGIYRRHRPGHGWAEEHDYGLGFTQYRGNWSFNIYYALRNGCNYLDGVLGFGAKTLF